MASCQYCNSPIQWIKTPRGKVLPVDQEQIEVDTTGQTDGPTTVVVTEDGRMLSGSAAVGTQAQRTSANLVRGYISHFATCPYFSLTIRREGGDIDQR